LSRYLSITAVALVLGVMVVQQFRITGYQSAHGIPADRAQELTVELKQLEKERADLAAEVEDLERKLAQARMGYSQAAEALRTEITKLRLLAGLEPVRGKGVEVVVVPRQGTGVFTVRDEDLLRIVNELRGAGAEALAINGQRLIATSEIRTSGAHITVNLIPVAAPYRILAIGNPEYMKNTLEMRGGVVETLREWGIDIAVFTREDLTIPGYQGKTSFEYARTS
jgi:uncharacterized protein YlxW (UPF0749 family)